MSSFFKICRSIFKKNKGFSICLFLMSLLSFATIILAANFASSAKETIYNFFDYTGVPDILVSTELMASDDLEEINEIDGIKEVSHRIVVDINVETKDKKQFSSRILSYDENGSYKLEFQKQEEISDEKIKVYVSYEFADYNNICVGDQLLIVTPLGDYEVTVGATISSVETFKCLKDEMSNYEAYEFVYIYLPNSEFLKIGFTDDITNSFSIYFEDNLSNERKNEILNEMENKLGTDFISKTIVSEMPSMKSIEDDVNTIRILCIFIPGVVLLISLGFSFEFLKIIIDNQKETIALLKSLGYSTSKISAIFIIFSLLINEFALIIGLPIGYLLLRVCVNLIASSNGILVLSFDIKILLTILLILLVFVIGVLSTLFTTKSISKVDPVSISSRVDYEVVETPKVVKNLKCSPFLKIALASVFRKYKRLVVGFLCMAACITTMSIGFEGNLTIAHPIDAVYGDRFRYDLMVRDITEFDYSDIKESVSNIEVIEPICLFESDVNGKTVNVSSVVKNSELIVLKNANGDAIYPESGVIIDEMYAEIYDVKIGDNILLGEHPLKVTGIAREISVTFFYISEETATNVYSSSINCVFIKAKDASNINEIKNEITEINPEAYFTLLSSQKQNMDDRCKAMRTIMLILGLLSFLIGSLFVFNITIIDFNEKISNYITLRALGASVNKLTKISFFENLIRLLLGIILAIPLSYLANSVLLKLLSVETAQYVMVKFWPCLFVAIAISFLYVVVSLLVSRRIIKKINIVEKLNEME